MSKSLYGNEHSWLMMAGWQHTKLLKCRRTLPSLLLHVTMTHFGKERHNNGFSLRDLSSCQECETARSGDWTHADTRRETPAKCSVPQQSNNKTTTACPGYATQTQRNPLKGSLALITYLGAETNKNEFPWTHPCETVRNGKICL